MIYKKDLLRRVSDSPRTWDVSLRAGGQICGSDQCYLRLSSSHSVQSRDDRADIIGL